MWETIFVRLVVAVGELQQVRSNKLRKLKDENERILRILTNHQIHKFGHSISQWNHRSN